VRVLVDRHHAGLYHSVQLLGDRLGWDVYTPVGHAWWDEGYWIFGLTTYDDDRLARQFLSTDGWVNASGDVWWTKDPEFPDRWIHGVTLEDAKRQHWDLVIASLQDNQHGFARFAREHGATFVIQIGNTGQMVDWDLDPLALNSSEMPMVGRGVRYHQPMTPIAFTEPVDHHSGASFVNCMPSMGSCWDLLERARESIGVSVFGIDGPEGNVKPFARTIELMAAVGWGWHDKAQGDGFGHVIHSWAAVGRPLVGHASHYEDKVAERFWVDGETCIDLDRHSLAEAIEIITTISPDDHARMCRAIRAKFDEIDWDAEAAMIGELLGAREPVAA
jgi:hypothetical protein